MRGQTNVCLVASIRTACRVIEGYRVAAKFIFESLLMIYFCVRAIHATLE